MVKTNAIPHLAGSNAPSFSANDIRPINAPIAIPNVWFWIGCAVVVLALAALAWWWWRRRQARMAAPAPVIVIPPHVKARAKLREALSLLDQPGPFCVLISDTIRIYLEERFELHAPERTTEEFLEELQGSPLLTHDQKQTLGEFLAGCDLVKFARYEPARTELERIYETALRLVEETEPALIAMSGQGAPAGGLR